MTNKETEVLEALGIHDWRIITRREQSIYWKNENDDGWRNRRICKNCKKVECSDTWSDIWKIEGLKDRIVMCNRILDGFNVSELL